MRVQRVQNLPSIYQLTDFSFPKICIFCQMFLRDDMKCFFKVSKFSRLIAAGSPIILFFFARETEGSGVSFPTCPCSQPNSAPHIILRHHHLGGKERKRRREKPLSVSAPPRFYGRPLGPGRPLSLCSFGPTIPI